MSADTETPRETEREKKNSAIENATDTERKNNCAFEKATDTDSKNNCSLENATDTERKIIKQIEYYFGDINLGRDKFLIEAVKENEGWVALETMLKFNRLAAITNEFGEIVAALRKSDSGLMEISEDELKIRRTPSMPVPEANEKTKEELTTRTVYCKGFPLDSKLDEILDFFNRFSGVVNVLMRNYNDKATNTWHFKGSVFVNFKTISAAEEFLSYESVQYNDEELKRMWMKEYGEMKLKEKFEERLKRKKKLPAKEEVKETQEEESEFPLGTVIELTGFKEDSPTKREKLKEAIESLGIAVAYIDYSTGDETAWIRLEEANSSKTVAEKVAEAGGFLDVGENKLSVRVLEGEEEKTFLEKAKADQLKRRSNIRYKSKSRGRGRGGSRQKYGRKRKAHSPAGDDHKSKVKA